MEPPSPATPAARRIPFRPLGGLFEQDDVAAVTRILEDVASGEGSFFPLPEEKEFEQRLARLVGASHAVAVNSCGTALDLCMMALGIGPEDEVIVPPLTFVCTATCAAARGARVVFADIDPNTLCLDPEAVRLKISPRTKAIVPVHFAGLSCDIDGFARITKEFGIPVIYDAAHAVGAMRNGVPIGNAGLASCFSFQSNKNMTTLGEGGAVTTDDPSFAEIVRQKKTFGFVYGSPLRNVTVGFNYRLTKIQMACGLTQLDKIDRIVELRLQRFLRMQELLADVGELLLPPGISRGHACHLYILRLNTSIVPFSREDLRRHLKERFAVETVVHYPAVYSWEAFEKLDHDRSGCPNAEAACSQVFSLPIFPSTSWEDLDYLRSALKQSISELSSRSVSGGTK